MVDGFYPSENWQVFECPLGLTELPMLGAYHFRQAERGLTPHTHTSAFEICYLAQGCQTYRLANRDYCLAAGDIFVTLPDETHSTGPYPQERGNLYWLQIQPDPPKGILDLDFQASQTLVHKLSDLPTRCFTASKNMEAEFENALKICTEPSCEFTRLKLTQQITQILLEVINSAHSQPAARQSTSMNRVLEYIEGHLTENLPIDQLADVACLSTSWFKARFKREVGISPAEYVLRRKIEKAHELLKKGDKSITQIAFHLGFSSSQYFATVFRRFTNKSPREIKKI